jgi:aristolochene synthase
MRFSMDLRLTNSDLSRVRGLEQNCSRQISVVNDIYSWEKEYKASLKDDAEGSVFVFRCKRAYGGDRIEC